MHQAIHTGPVSPTTVVLLPTQPAQPPLASHGVQSWSLHARCGSGKRMRTVKISKPHTSTTDRAWYTHFLQPRGLLLNSMLYTSGSIDSRQEQL